jgi:hypothetical protein
MHECRERKDAQERPSRKAGARHLLPALPYFPTSLYVTIAPRSSQGVSARAVHVPGADVRVPSRTTSCPGLRLAWRSARRKAQRPMTALRTKRSNAFALALHRMCDAARAGRTGAADAQDAQVSRAQGCAGAAALPSRSRCAGDLQGRGKVGRRREQSPRYTSAGGYWLPAYLRTRMSLCVASAGRRTGMYKCRERHDVESDHARAAASLVTRLE